MNPSARYSPSAGRRSRAFGSSWSTNRITSSTPSSANTDRAARNSWRPSPRRRCSGSISSHQMIPSPGAGRLSSAPPTARPGHFELHPELRGASPAPERRLRRLPGGRRREIEPPVVPGEAPVQERLVGGGPMVAGEPLETHRQLGGRPEGEDRVAPAHPPQQRPQHRLDQFRRLGGVEPQQIAVPAAAPAQRPGADQRPVRPLDADRPHGGQLPPPPRIGGRTAGQRRLDPFRGAGGLAGEPVPVDQRAQALDVVGAERPGVHRRSSTTFPNVRSPATRS